MLRRYVLTQQTPSIAEAVQRLFIDDIQSRCDPTTFLDADKFRRDGCYNEATDAVLRRHEGILRLLFSLLAAKRGPTKGWLNFEAWAKFCRFVGLVGVDLTERDVAFAFTWSRMLVAQPYSTQVG